MLLEKTGYMPGVDRLILTGDLVDRGPDSVGTVHLAYQAGAEVVLGNHDEKYIRWMQHEERRRQKGKANPMTSISAEQKATCRELAELGLDHWMNTWPSYIYLNPSLIVVHAGLQPGVAVADQKRSNFYFMRYVDENNKLIVLDTGGKDAWAPAPEGGTLWAELWQGPESVIYGHNVEYHLDLPRVDVPTPGVCCVGIDTGCVHGGRLTALVMQDFRSTAYEFVQVQALNAYVPRMAA